MSKIDNIIAEMDPKLAKVVVHLREVHSCLMTLDRKRIIELQERAVYLNYLAGDGRKKDVVPHIYQIPDGKGGTIEKETYFTYLLGVNR